ncbi:MAG TPA: protein kinase [Nannocystaceae bacterium]|nr:protein kinase [Nannocystaceae bacterium]
MVVRRIAGGGMAELYLARLDGPNRFVKPVALKLMHPHLVDTPEFVGMFMREARIAASLQHPQIVQVLDVGESDGEYFLALEYVHGVDLRRVLSEQRGAPLPLGAALRVVIDIATALHHAHSLCDGSGRPLGIVHRDVSPSNVLIAYDGAVKLTDFGIARMTEQTHVTATGSIKGKPGYMSPEQCLQEHVDGRSDVFALGVVLYELTTGRPAFAGDMIATMNRVIDGRFTPPGHIVRGYPSALAMIVTRALAPRAEHRYPSAAAFKAALEGFARTQQGLDTSTDALVNLLAARFGAPALPDLGTPTPTLRVVPTMPSMPAMQAATSMQAPTTVVTSGARRRTRSHRVTVGAVGVLAGALLGWQIARTSAAFATERPAAEVPVSAASPELAIDRAPPRAAAQPLAPSAPAITPPVVSPPQDEPEITLDAPVARTHDDAPRAKRRRAQRKSKSPVVEVTAPPSRSADAMLPRSAR